MQYEPMAEDPAACHSGRVSWVVNKAAFLNVKTKKYHTLHVIETYKDILEAIIAKTDEVIADNVLLNEVKVLMGSYCINKAIDE